MNKRLLALVATTTLTASIAAQADSDNVKIYGRLNGVLESTKASGTTSVPSRNQVTSNASNRIGVKGAEDLGGGLKAIWQIESAVRIDGGGRLIGSRNTNVGLAGNFGTVFYGQWDTPYKFIGLPLDPLSSNGIGNASFYSIIGNRATTAANTGTSFVRRQQNTAQYWTPNWGGFSARIAYSANEEKTATVDPSLLSTAVMYKNGSLYLSFGYEIHDEYADAGLTDTGNVLAGTYAFGNTKVGFLFEQLEYETSATGTTERDAYSITLAQKVGKGIVRAAYTVADDSEGNGTAAGSVPAPGNNTGATQISLAYGHILSKRTELYAHYAKIDNDAGAAYDLINTPLGVTAGADPQVIGVGIVHRF